MHDIGAWPVSFTLKLKAVDLIAVRQQITLKPDKDWSFVARVLTAAIVSGRLTALVDDLRRLTIRVAEEHPDTMGAAKMRKAGMNIALRVESLRRGLTYGKGARAAAATELTDISDELTGFAREVELLEETA